MPIVTLQQQMRELGRIRTGIQVASRGKTGKRPEKLGTFRLTTSERFLLDHAAKLYGGVVAPWESPSGPQFELVTDSATLPIVVPPGQPFDQYYELWTGGGCVRRCNGVTMLLDMTRCACPPDPVERNALAANGEACKPTSRLNVILPEIPDLGVWRLESHGYYAATELAGAADVLARATQTGMLIPARLRLDQREKRVPGKPTQRYAVPVIELAATMADLAIGGGTASQLPAGGQYAQLAPGRPQPPALPSTELPERSDFRAPTPVVVERMPERESAYDPPLAPNEPGVRAASALCGALPAKSGLGLTKPCEQKPHGENVAHRSEEGSWYS